MGAIRFLAALSKITIEASTAELSAIQTAFQCHAAAVVFLERLSDGPVRLTPISAADAFHGLVSNLPLFPQPVYEAHRAALRDLVAGGAFELRYHDLDEAVSLIEPLAG